MEKVDTRLEEGFEYREVVVDLIKLKDVLLKNEKDGFEFLPEWSSDEECRNCNKMILYFRKDTRKNKTNN